MIHTPLHDKNGEHTFYIMAQAEGGKVKWQAPGTPMKLIVMCGPLSTSLTSPSITEGTLASPKFVDVSMPATGLLTFAEFVNAEPVECPILTYTVLFDEAPADKLRTDMLVTAPGTNPIIVKPKNDAIDGQYIFKIKAVAKGGA